MYRDSWTDGDVRYDSEVDVRALKVDREVLGIAIISRDITEDNRFREEVARLLDDKEVLLREVHHRIKNNIHTIRTMLEIRAMSTGNSEASVIINDAQLRLGGMMTLYDRLYRGDDFRVVSAGDFFETLVKDVLEGSPIEVVANCDVADISLPPRIASTLGIIINELLANALKYAFAPDRDNRLDLVFRRDSGNVQLVIADNGPGFEAGTSSGGFGMELLESFSAQMGAEYSITSDNGCRFELMMPGDRLT